MAMVNADIIAAYSGIDRCMVQVDRIGPKMTRCERRCARLAEVSVSNCLSSYYYDNYYDETSGVDILNLDKLQYVKVLCVVDQVTSNFLVTEKRRKIGAECEVWKRHYLHMHNTATDTDTAPTAVTTQLHKKIQQS